MQFRLAPELREMAREMLLANESLKARLAWSAFDLDRIGFVYEDTCEQNKDAARIRKLDPMWRDLLEELGDVEWDYLIEVYGYHAEGKSDNWMRILLYHELRHIGFDGDLVEHDVEDFYDILERFGVRWVNDQDLPDIREGLDAGNIR